MKKYFILIVISLIIGFFLSIFVINQYSDNKGIVVYKEGHELYFFKYGEFKSKEEMENNTINLENYIYKNDADIYKVYIAITKNADNVDKIKKYYSKYSLEVEKFYISNDKFVKKIDDLDNILKSTGDEMTIGEIISQELSSYDEVVINDRQN